MPSEVELLEQRIQEYTPKKSMRDVSTTKPKQETMKKNQVEILSMKKRQYPDNRSFRRREEIKHFKK